MKFSFGRSRAPEGPLACFTLALVLRFAVVGWAATRFPPAADGSYYQVIAARIAAGHGYTWLWPDGAVTYAAHYPVGYPALLGAAYSLFGVRVGLAMVLNAIIGALGAWAAALAASSVSPRAGLFAGILVAVHPGLVAYTPAIMTEGITATLLMVATALVVRGDGLRIRRIVFVGLVCGCAVLVRPQCLILSPLFGALLVFRAREHVAERKFLLALIGTAGLVSVLAVLPSVPWVIRNCIQMKSCSVSFNGGWNLLIGTDPAAAGGWAALRVPEACRAVFDEAEKDACFRQAAVAAILTDPWSWLLLIPKKLAVTFDYCGAAGFYLHESNASFFSADDKLRFGVVETVFERVMLMSALLGMRGVAGPGVREHTLGARIRAAPIPSMLLALGLIVAATRSAFISYLALSVLSLFAFPRPTARGVLGLCVGASVLSVALTHSVFFGAGRYSLVVLPLVTALAGIGINNCFEKRTRGL